MMFFSRPAGVKFVDRGDPSEWDFILSDLITDGEWHDLDLSSIVPIGTTVVILLVQVDDNLNNSRIQFRTKGNVNIYNCPAVVSPVQNVSIYGSATVHCNANRKLEYRTMNTTYTTINIMVVGSFVE